MPKNLFSSLGSIESKLGYSFNNKEILFQAFTHSSFLNESTVPLQSNERLEFLGDSVLNLFVSDFLFREFREKEEGELSKLKANLVCQESCYTMIQMLNIAEHLLVGRGEKSPTHLANHTLAADLFEAIVGAIFLDGGWGPVSSFLQQKFFSFFHEKAITPPMNAKAELQEWLAKRGRPLPEYEVIETKGPSHQKEFTVVVSIAKTLYGSGVGKTKKEAQQKAAEETLKTLNVEIPL